MKDTVLSIIRHALTAVGTALVAKGVLTSVGSEEIIGAVIGLVGAVWGPVDEYLFQKKVQAQPANVQAALK